MDDDEIINIKKTLKNLTEKYELLAKENAENKKIIKKNEKNIINLNTQLKILKLKHQNEINALNEKYKQLLKQKENGVDKNEIIRNDKNINIINIQNKSEEVEKLIDKKLREFEDKVYQILGKKPPKEKKGKINDLKERTLKELFYNKLLKIFYDESEKIDINDKNDLKKISLALIIKGKDLPSLLGEFLDQTLNNNFNQLDENRKGLIGNKKSDVYLCLDELGDIKLNKIDKKNNEEINEFIGDLRNKFGISEEDINYDDLNKEIKNNKYDKKKIIESILKKIKLIREN
jgi:hypothetical protein